MPKRKFDSEMVEDLFPTEPKLSDHNRLENKKSDTPVSDTKSGTSERSFVRDPNKLVRDRSGNVVSGEETLLTEGDHEHGQ